MVIENHHYTAALEWDSTQRSTHFLKIFPTKAFGGFAEQEQKRAQAAEEARLAGLARQSAAAQAEVKSQVTHQSHM